MNSVGVPEGEPHVPDQAPPGLLDRAERLPRVRALVIAVLEGGKPRIPLRKAADRCWSRQETMVWFSCTLMLTLLP